MPARQLHLPADPIADLRDLLLGMAPDDLGAFCSALDPADLDLVEHVLSSASHRRWVPRPHQVPPPLDDPWEVWLLLAGRGAGKTDACAHEMNRHAEGPPCMPGLPGGHRMAIIAPTLGDASDACVHGPSGLQAHNPAIREQTRKGGTFVIWPSGAEAKLFGAYTKQDVERLRAGGNRAVARGTLVSTRRGPVPVEQVARGDLVATRTGWRPVNRCQSSGVLPTVAVLLDSGLILRCTPDHPIATPDGFTEAWHLTPGGNVWTWSEERQPTVSGGSDGTGCDGTNGRPATSPHPGAGYSTGPSTQPNTGRSRPAGTSTTSTATAATTLRATSLPWTPPPTTESTHGAPTGTLLVAAPPNVPGLSMTSPALTAAPGSRPGPLMPPAAPAAASVHHEHGSTACAACVATGSPPRPDTLAPPALDRVRAVWPIADGEVWDLEVDGHHEFVADGVLVGNCFVWVEELAAWRYLRACWNHMMFGLRLGDTPRVIASTTPKNRPQLRKIIAADTTVVSTATTDDNPHLAARVRQRLLDTYAGTRLGRQELLGEMLEDVEGALWSDELIEQHRLVGAEPPRMRRIVVAVDPSWGTTNDECGIVVAGKGWDNEAYVLADYSIRGGPRAWAERVAEAYHSFRADAVLAEGNFQGEQVKLAMRQVEHPQGKPPFRLVNASRGKALRAEPVVMLYEQGRVRHVGRLALLEHQMTSWVPTEPADAEAGHHDDDGEGPVVTSVGAGESETNDDEQLPSSFSPDRVDALVFALTDLMLGNEGPASVHRPGAAPAPRRLTRSPSVIRPR